MDDLGSFLSSNAALLVAVVALIISLRANFTASSAHKLNIANRKADDKQRLAEKKRETLNELDLQYTRMATLSMITAQKVLMFRDHPALHSAMPDEFDRLKSNLNVMERMRAKYQEHRKSVEDIPDGADIARQEEMLAKTRQLTIHIEKDIAHEQATLESMLAKLAAP